jgi:ABC-type multidrug transport system fused ATPase/permease subunit
MLTSLPQQPITRLLRRLWQHISLRRRGQFVFLLLLMILASFAEILSIGALIPFLGVLTKPESVFEHPVLQPLIDTLLLTKPDQLLLPLTLVFGFAVLLTGAVRLLLLWANTHLSYSAGADLSISIYRRTLYQPYAVHVARNSSEIISGISNKTGSAIQTINMSLNLISSSFMLIGIFIALLAVDSFVAISAFAGFGLMYIFIVQLTRNRMSNNSQIVARESTNVIKSLQEGLGGIRDVLIDGSQTTYCKIYFDADQPLRRAQGNSTFINYAPRYGMEALGMLFIAGLAFMLAMQEDGIARAIPVLGALALGAQRLLPVLQQAYGAWTGIKGNQASLQETLDLLDQPLPEYADKPVPKPIPFDREINLKQISFQYSPKSTWVLKNLNLRIKKGSRVGFIGVTGSGKSTMLDIVMGLLAPTNGIIEIDGLQITPSNYRAWQSHIAHVPQNIFLADSTIEENIAFGVPKNQIDSIRVREAARLAQIADIIETWPKLYRTVVGERGIRLSGGQRQRIGIARALYKQADVIIFDEATSSLDNETEEAVMHAIESLSNELTLLIIAHRLTTLKNCTQIVELNNSNIKRIGNYQDIINQPSF